MCTVVAIIQFYLVQPCPKPLAILIQTLSGSSKCQQMLSKGASIDSPVHAFCRIHVQLVEPSKNCALALLGRGCSRSNKMHYVDCSAAYWCSIWKLRCPRNQSANHEDSALHVPANCNVQYKFASMWSVTCRQWTYLHCWPIVASVQIYCHW